MSPSDPHIEKLVDDLRGQRIDRRRFLQRAGALGLSLPAASALLAACGGGGSSEGTTTGAGTTGGTQQAGGGGTINLHLDEDI